MLKTAALFTLLLVAQASADKAESIYLNLSINDYLYYAVLTENRELLLRIGGSRPVSQATHYRGNLEGYPDSALRLTRSSRGWHGVVILDGELYKVRQQRSDEYAPVLSAVSVKSLGRAWNRPDRLCGMGGPLPESAELSSNMMAETITAQSVAVTPAPCDNPINGLCLLPHIELAYDLSYQAMSNFGMTVLDRAISEINEMELFFERGLGYRFSQLSLTMLDSDRDNEAGSATATDLDAFVKSLRVKRLNGDFPYLTSVRSIFHFVTGRNFPPVSAGNVVGTAFPSALCSAQGYSVGVTDAGDVGFVSDPAESAVAEVMAHEIGHNLGAKHDGDDNSCEDDQFLMAPFISSSFTDFSSCSVDYMQQTEQLKGSSACLDYPIDIAIADDCDNPAEPAKDQAFTAAFSVATQRQDSSGLASLIGIQGTIADPGHGQFISVKTGGGDVCSVAPDGLSYQCSLVNPGESFELRVESIIDALAIEFVAQHLVYSEEGSLVDVDASNDSLEQYYNAFSAGGSELVGSCPNVSVSTNQTDVVENSGGGGGGSIGLGMFALLFMNFLLNFRRRYSG